MLNTAPRLVFPWALALLVLIPWTVWVGARIRSLSPVRKWIAVILRVTILAALIGALGGAELVKTADKLAVFFLLDHSDSVPEETRLAALEQIRKSCEIYLTSNDEAGLIVFGEEPSIELSVAPNLELEKVLSVVGGEQTDAAAALRLALAAFPQGYMKRLVLYSDGNETQGAAAEEAKLAQAAGAEINVVPIDTGRPQEVRVREVAAPGRVNTDEPFQLRVVVYAEQDCEATLRVFQRVGGQKQHMRPQHVTLQAGDNTFLLPQELRRQGFYEYEVVVESEADTVLANNEGRAYTIIQGEPVVLYVEGDPEHSVRLGPALETEGLRVEQHDPGTMPTSLALLQNYDAVVLSDVSSTDFSSGHMKTIEALVHDFGVGLVMIGGPNSFGAGGYLDTPIEKALPVDMDLKQRKILPRGALVLVMHTCEMPDGNAWAREIGLAALNVLASQDLMGALGYMHTGGDSWIYELQPVADKSMMARRLRQASAQIGDMPKVEPTLRMAYNALLKADAAVKRVVMISDGDPQPPPPQLLTALAEATIGVSTVCVAPHSPSDKTMLRAIAQRTGGEFYDVTNPRNLPQIFVKEASVVKRGMLIEETFTPKPKHSSELLMGLAENGVPVLHGYVATMAKDSATVPLVSHEDDPVLAHWRYGLGKSVAFTSDVTNRWAVDWLRWEGFSPFWARAVRWAMRETGRTTFSVDTYVRDGKGHIRIDAVDDQGRFVNFLRPRGVVTGPAPDFARHEIDLVQTGPGIYEGAFPVSHRGVYMANITYVNADGSQGMLPTGLALGYSREYEYNTTNLPLLEQVATLGGGETVTGLDNPFEHNLEATPTVTPVWQYLAAFAACLFPFEIFFRRVVLNFNAAYVWLAGLLRKLPPLRRLVPAPARKEGPVTGFYGAAASGEFDYTSAKGTPGRSFGLIVETRATDARETASGQAQTGQAGAPASMGRTEYTQRLLAAKERALARRKRPRNGNEDKENT